MKAARLAGPRQFEFLDIPTPEIKDNEVLVRMEQLAICGSDVVTMVPSRICMKKETATTKAIMRDCRPKLVSEGCSVVRTTVMVWNFKEWGSG